MNKNQEKYAKIKEDPKRQSPIEMLAKMRNTNKKNKYLKDLSEDATIASGAPQSSTDGSISANDETLDTTEQQPTQDKK